MYDFEKSLAAKRGFEVFCGTDEAGRGPLAGPVYAAAVCLGECKIEGLNDSKKLSEKKREQLFDTIVNNSIYAISFSDVDQIEELNILAASQRAMRNAVDEICKVKSIEAVLVDGNIARGFNIPAICVVGGDAKCASIAAASILAKVARDREMKKLDAVYPGYGFEKHKGYPTKEHYEALKRLGPSPVHRMSFLKKFYEKENKIEKPVTRGKIGEDIALNYLLKIGHTLLDRNFSYFTGEIDIVTMYEEFVVFTEVKLRKNNRYADAVECIDNNKVSKIRRTAELWLSRNKILLQPRFDVIEIYLEDTIGAIPKINHIASAF